MSQLKYRDYKKDYEEFWKEIVENQDGSLNKDQVMRELSDHIMLQEHCTAAYMELSNGMISKPNTLPEEVVAAHNDYISETFVMKDDINDLINDSAGDSVSKEDLKELLK